MNRLKEALRQSGKYYSDKCFSEKFHIYRNGFEVSRNQFDQIKDYEIPNCKILIKGKYNVLRYNQKEFILCDGEYLTVADVLFQKAFKGHITVTYYYINEIVKKTNRINSTYHYIIKVECQFAFKDMKGNLEYYKMDYNATVSDATNKIPFLFEYGTVLPNEITILDENIRPITDKKRTLNSIPDFEKAIFFSISDKSKYSKDKALNIQIESTARNCYRDTSEVYKYLVSEGLFYTQKCLDSNLCLSINGIEKKPDEFKDVKEIKKSQVSIRLYGRTVTINYDEKKFIAQEGEAIKNIIELVKKVCKYANNITVSKIEYNKLLKLSAIQKLQSSDKYVIQSDFRFRFRFRFKPLTEADSMQMIDYESTVADGQNHLSMIYGCNPSCIVIFDDNKDEITDFSRRLNTIPNFAKQIYFDIDQKRETTSPLPHEDEVPSIKSKSKHESKSYSSDEPPPPSPKSKSNPARTLKDEKDKKPKTAPSKSPQDSFDDDEDIKTPTKSLRPKIKKPVIKYTTVDDTEKPSQPNKSSSSSPKKTRNPVSESFSPSVDSGTELIEINFIFDKSNEKKYYDFKEKLRSNMTMKEIEEMIAEKYDIDDKITINSKEDGELTPIGSRTTIESNLDDICEKVNGKSKYYLYIKITKSVSFGSIRKGKKASDSTKLVQSTKDALKKPLIRPKKKSDSDDDDEDYKVELTKPKPKPKPKYSRSSDDNDDDDDSSDEKKSRSNFSPSENSASLRPVKDKKEKIDQIEKEEDIFLSNDKKIFRFLSVPFIENFKKHSIGRGATSEVFRVVNTKYPNKIFALKIIYFELIKTENDDDDENSNDDSNEEEDAEVEDQPFKLDVSKLKRFYNEFEVLEQLDHPNIIKTYGFCLGDKKHSPSILLEYCQTNLEKIIKKLTDEERIQIIIEISSAMQKIHEMGIIHRDLKPENILIDENRHAKVSDFGISTCIDVTSSRTTFVGTLRFMAPELIKQCKTYDEKVDVYSFGVVLYFIIMRGKYPKFDIVKIVTGVSEKLPSEMAKTSRKIIQRCLSFNSNERPSFKDINEILSKEKNNLI